ncbi:MAG: hypothetical protein KGJ23_00735 [Euryarchaeota archaeon]|nr:hypothetical protein [Euryarchaeota archaeon]MDE1835121.1 hypothetical protein [Euryarchaeota archaeon]MDE1880693.1 hypothetical protein [Euryarchaeota archaeon]MDE2044916.1 hypothetical protein [Thermoplasmata archaeon]
MLTKELRRFLLRGTDPSVRYFTLRDLLDRPESDPAVRRARSEIGREGWAARILGGQQKGGFWERFNGDGDELYGPKYIATNWRLIVLSDLGMTRRDPRVRKAAELLLKTWDQPRGGVFGGKYSEVCVTGNCVRMMTRFGYREDERVQRAIDWLVKVQKKDGGWHCFPSRTGTLDGWEPMAAFAAVPPQERSAGVRRAIERGAEFYLGRRLLRDPDGVRYRPWERLHYPNHYYYDLLVGLDFLTAVGYGSDPRMRRALDLLGSKRRRDGAWALEGIHPDLEPDSPYRPKTPVYPMMLEYPGQPSRWATMLALRVQRRAGRL